jgi:hypothetical protein
MRHRHTILAATVALLASATPASAYIPGGYYTPQNGGVTCSWDPRGDYIQCSTPSMARTGRYYYMGGREGVGSTAGEVMRGGRRVRAGVTIESVSISCTWGRTSVTCRRLLGGGSFKLGAGVHRLVKHR